MRAAVCVITFDRPEQLRVTLAGLVAQHCSVPLEILVVDNHAASGLTRPVVEAFPSVRYIEGPGRGCTAGRNTAIANTTAEFLLWTNDDVVVPLGWAQGLLDQFTRPDIMVVCGQVHPVSLDLPAEQMFHRYCGFTRADRRIEYTRQWLAGFRHKSPPTHEVGVGNCFAVRASCFADERVGLFNEALGAGTAGGSADDQYFWYRVLSAGHTIVYEPAVSIEDCYLTDVDELQAKVFNYGKAMTAYELELITRDRDWRGIVQLLVILPVWRVRQLAAMALEGAAHRRRPADLDMFVANVRGNLAGFGSWRSARRAAAPYYRAHAGAPLRVA